MKRMDLCRNPQYRGIKHSWKNCMYAVLKKDHRCFVKDSFGRIICPFVKDAVKNALRHEVQKTVNIINGNPPYSWKGQKKEIINEKIS